MPPTKVPGNLAADAIGLLILLVLGAFAELAVWGWGWGWGWSPGSRLGLCQLDDGLEVVSTVAVPAEAVPSSPTAEGLRPKTPAARGRRPRRGGLMTSA